MKTSYFKWTLSAILIVAVADASFAQAGRPVKKRPVKPAATSAYGKQPVQNNTSAYGNLPKDTTVKPPAGSAYGNNTGNNKLAIDTSLPITVIKSSGNGLLDSIKMSLRNDAAVDQNLIKEKTAMPYENIREDDAVYRVRVWREIDGREKQNLAFQYAADEDNGSQRFISILLRAIQNGDITAFSGDDDRFSTPITAEAAMNAFGSGRDTVASLDRDGNTIGYQVRQKSVDPDSIYKFRVKEEWVFDKESSRLFVRILGIAPVMPFYRSDGVKIEGSERPLWWIYYPDARSVLSKASVYNPKNYGARMSWEDLFEGRMFSSYIVQSTFDNPFNLPLSAVYPNNTLFRLLEGEKIKEKIFNYEQSLWSY